MSKIKRKSIVKYIGYSKDRTGKLATVDQIGKDGTIAHISFLDNSLNTSGSWSCRVSSLELADPAEIVYPFQQYTSAQLASLIMDEYLDPNHTNHHSYNPKYDSAVDSVLASLFSLSREDVEETLEVSIENSRHDFGLIEDFIVNVVVSFHKTFRQIGVIDAVIVNGNKLSINHTIWTLLKSRHQTFNRLVTNVFENIDAYFIPP